LHPRLPKLLPYHCTGARVLCVGPSFYVQFQGENNSLDTYPDIERSVKSSRVSSCPGGVALPNSLRAIQQAHHWGSSVGCGAAAEEGSPSQQAWRVPSSPRTSSGRSRACRSLASLTTRTSMTGAPTASPATRSPSALARTMSRMSGIRRWRGARRRAASISSAAAAVAHVSVHACVQTWQQHQGTHLVVAGAGGCSTTPRRRSWPRCLSRATRLSR